MAHENDSNQIRTGSATVAPGTIVAFDRKVHRLYVSTTVTTISISFDGGNTSLPIPSGLTEFNINPEISFRMVGAGSFTILGITG
jgi:hypothetical protein